MHQTHMNTYIDISKWLSNNNSQLHTIFLTSNGDVFGCGKDVIDNQEFVKTPILLSKNVEMTVVGKLTNDFIESKW